MKKTQPVRTMQVAAFLAYKSFLKGNLSVTILTVLILVLVACNLFFVPGLLGGLVDSANDKLINTYTGHLVVEAGGQNENSFKINHVDELISGIETIPGVVAATSRNSLGANIKYDDNPDEKRQLACSVSGINALKEQDVFNVYKCIVEGSYLDPRDRDKILLGMQVAGCDEKELEMYSRSLRYVHAGDKVTVTYSNGIVKEYTVKGIFHTGFIQTDLQAMVTDTEMKSIVPGINNKANEIHIKLSDQADFAAVVQRIKMFDNDLEFQTWEDNAGLVNSMTTSFRLINNILDVVNMLVAGITIFIVTYVDVINKKRQIGIQRAIGIKDRAIIYSYLLRALVYVIVGFFIAWAFYVNVLIPLEAARPFYFPFGYVYLSLTSDLLIRTAMLLFIVSLIAALIPVFMVMRVKILDAIWG